MKTQAIKLGLGAWALAVWVAAQAAAPVITNITMVGATPGFGVHSDLGVTNQIQCCTSLSQTNWEVLTNLLVAQTPYWFVDGAALPSPGRFYRVLALATNSAPPRHDADSRGAVHDGGQLGWRFLLLTVAYEPDQRLLQGPI